MSIFMQEESIMKISKKTNPYLESTADRYVSKDKPVYSLSTSVDIQYVWENNRPTSEIKDYRLWFAQEGLPPFAVKFYTEPVAPKFLAKVNFEKLAGLEMKSNVFFQADVVKEIK